MDNYIKREEFNQMIKNYLITEGREIILEVLKEQTEYFIPNVKEENSKIEEKIDEKETEKQGKDLKMEKIKLSSDIVNKKEAIKEFIEDLDKYDEKERVEIKVGQLKQFIIKVLNLNEELDRERREHTANIKRLEAEERELKYNIESLKEKYNTSENRVRELNGEIEDLETKERMLKVDIENKNREIINLGNTITEKVRENDRLENEKMNLENKNSSLNENIRVLNREVTRLTDEVQEKKLEIREIEIEKEKLNNRLGKLDGVEVLQKLYEHYLEVSSGYRNRLEKLVKTEDVSSFIACCYNIGTMDDLWDSLNVEVRNGNLADAYILREIFEYFVIQQNKKYDESLYKLLIPNIGEEFDPTKHMAVNGNSSGKIEEVIFPGYGSMESKANLDQTDEERGFKKIRKLAMVKVR